MNTVSLDVLLREAAMQVRRPHYHGMRNTSLSSSLPGFPKTTSAEDSLPSPNIMTILESVWILASRSRSDEQQIACGELQVSEKNRAQQPCVNLVFQAVDA